MEVIYNAESVTPCLGLVDKRNFEPESHAKTAELDAKNGELDATNAHLETEMSRVWEELGNIGKETKQQEEPTNGTCFITA